MRKRIKKRLVVGLLALLLLPLSGCFDAVDMGDQIFAVNLALDTGKGNALRHKHYFGNLDIYRTVFNNAFQADFTPASRFWRDDPYDNQNGEAKAELENYFQVND